jgi:hypothetical protein
VTLKVRVANTPEESVDVSAPVIASLRPPIMFPLVLFHKAFELPIKNVGSPPVLSARKGPSVTPVNCSTVAFQLIVGIVQPQKPTALSILMSILRVVLIGFGLGPTVMSDVFVDRESTALITAFERLLSLGDAVCIESARAPVDWEEIEGRFRLAIAVSPELLLEIKIRHNNKKVFIAMDKIRVFFIFILP